MYGVVRWSYDISYSVQYSRVEFTNTFYRLHVCPRSCAPRSPVAVLQSAVGFAAGPAVHAHLAMSTVPARRRSPARARPVTLEHCTRFDRATSRRSPSRMLSVTEQDYCIAL